MCEGKYFRNKNKNTNGYKISSYVWRKKVLRRQNCLRTLQIDEAYNVNTTLV